MSIEEMTEKIKELRREYSELTQELKEMSGNESNYGEIWNKRAEIVRQISELESKLKK